MVMSWAQSSAGFSKTRRTRRALKGLLRGCLVKDKYEHLQNETNQDDFHSFICVQEPNEYEFISDDIPSFDCFFKKKSF